jgi:hyaluronan synthase
VSSYTTTIQNRDLILARRALLLRNVIDFGLWFIFFFIIYAILVIKIASADSLNNHLFFGFYSLVITSYIFSRFILSYFHRSVPFDSSYRPTVSFVVPAKNEGDNIRQTLLRFGEVDYPKDKIEIITINDGSTDNTLEEMFAAKETLSNRIDRIDVVDWKINKGKRHGMAEGVYRARGEVVIFVDSDSFIDKDCVSHLVKYFSIRDIGAVSGHTDVYNRDKNLLTQMQGVRYYIAFKVYKAAESVFGMVTCCPGCCSAYRREYLLEFIDEWLNQKFLGKQCTFGDDRSLTNFMIRKYRAAYSPEAKAHTIAPDNFRTYIKQQQRWKKSWIRETFIASSFIWKKNPLAAIFFYAYVFLAFTSPIVFLRAVVWYPYVHNIWPVVYLSGLLLMLLLHGLFYRLKVGRKAWFLAIISFWFHTVILMWQLPWALVTISDTKWGTR